MLAISNLRIPAPQRLLQMMNLAMLQPEEESLSRYGMSALGFFLNEQLLDSWLQPDMAAAGAGGQLIIHLIKEQYVDLDIINPDKRAIC